MAGALARLWYGDPPALTAAAARPNALTSAAQSLKAGRGIITPRYDRWQDEAWAYWQELGELYYGVRWLSEMLSRIRLVAATVPEEPGDEPAMVETGGTPVELVARFAGGVGGQAEILRRLTVQLSVPGEGWLVGEPAAGDRPDRWSVRSADEIRTSLRRPGRNGGSVGRRAGSSLLSGRAATDTLIEVVDETQPPGKQARWRVLPDDALVNRVWNPHDRWWAQPDSPVRHALSTARKLQLANQYIQAQFLSRLASAGLVVIPQEVDFPVSEQFEGLPDAVIREWIATAETAIQNPGSAAAIVPILMQLPSDLVEKIKHVDFTTAFDQKALEKREAAVRELATVLDLPAEVLLGMGDVNHWGQWQLEESGIKVHIAPRIETICHAFTEGWYRPMLAEAGEDPTKFLVWYDPSEIVVRPDKSEKVVIAYDRGEASGSALRREQGLDEADKPEDEDLKEWALKQLVLGKGGESLVPVAFKELTGEELDVPAPAPAPAAPSSGQDGQGNSTPTEEPPDANERRSQPDTRENPPPPPDQDLPAAATVQRDQHGRLMRMTSPANPYWPMERRRDGWYIKNVTYWERLPDAQTDAHDRHYAEIAARMNGGPGA